MSVIVYGETKKQIETQRECQANKSHQWHGPCIDEISRYCKCLNCYCLHRDLSKGQAEEHYEVENIGNYNE